MLLRMSVVMPERQLPLSRCEMMAETEVKDLRQMGAKQDLRAGCAVDIDGGDIEDDGNDEMDETQGKLIW